MHAKCSSVLGAFAKTAPLGLGVHFQYSMSACTSSSIGYLQCTVMGTCTFAFTPAAVWPCWRRSSLGASLIMLRRRRLPPPHIVQSNSSHSPTYCPHGHAAPLPCTRRAEPPAREGRQPPCPLCCRAQARRSTGRAGTGAQAGAIRAAPGIRAVRRRLKPTACIFTSVPDELHL